MNERVRLLAEQAEKLKRDEVSYRERLHNRYCTGDMEEEIFREKFAELIVRDLTDYIKDERGLRYLRYKLLKRYDLHNIEELKREFGVE